MGETITRLSDEMYASQLVSRDEDSAQARILQLSCTALAMLLGIFAALIITRQITRPLQDTLAVVDRIAAGDLTQHMIVTRRDELGVLQQGIQRMGSTLRDLIGGIRDGVTQIASAAEELVKDADLRGFVEPLHLADDLGQECGRVFNLCL